MNDDRLFDARTRSAVLLLGFASGLPSALIGSTFQSLLADAGLTLECDVPELATPDNLVLRAARAKGMKQTAKEFVIFPGSGGVKQQIERPDARLEGESIAEVREKVKQRLRDFLSPLPTDVNGAIDPGTDKVFARFDQTDGSTVGENGPPDMDGTVNGQISFDSPVGLAPAKYIFHVTHNGSSQQMDGEVTPLLSPNATISGVITPPAGHSAKNIAIEASQAAMSKTVWT